MYVCPIFSSRLHTSLTNGRSFNDFNDQFLLFDVLPVWSLVVVLAQGSDSVLIEQMTSTSLPPHRTGTAPKGYGYVVLMPLKESFLCQRLHLSPLHRDILVQVCPPCHQSEGNFNLEGYVLSACFVYCYRHPVSPVLLARCPPQSPSAG